MGTLGVCNPMYGYVYMLLKYGIPLRVKVKKKRS